MGKCEMWIVKWGADENEDEVTRALASEDKRIDPRELRGGEFGDTATTIIKPENRPGER